MQQDKNKLVRALQAACSKQEIALSPQEADLLVKHVLLVAEKNKSCNLTGIRDVEKSLYLNTVDSLFFVASYQQLIEEGLFLDQEEDSSHKEAPCFVDMGTGGGFPGIPFGIMTKMNGLLLDSVTKKAEAVEGFIADLRLQDRLEAKDLRTEELSKESPQTAWVALARALAPLEVLLEYASPLLRQGGFLVASKGLPKEDELAAAGAAEGETGMKLVSRETRELPEDMGHRELFVYQKTSSPTIKLPRKPGMATKRPISASARI